MIISLPAKRKQADYYYFFVEKLKMSALNQGRNEIRFNNSDGKCLLENWVEEVLHSTQLNGAVSRMHKTLHPFKDIHLANMAWWLKSAGALNFALSQEQCPISL